MQKATLASSLDDAYVEAQDEAGMRWTKRSGFNHDQIRDFQMLLQLIKPIMIKPDKISGSREIAQGSFGTIYSAVLNKRSVAVKRINKVAPLEWALSMMLEVPRALDMKACAA